MPNPEVGEFGTSNARIQRVPHALTHLCTHSCTHRHARRHTLLAGTGPASCTAPPPPYRRPHPPQCASRDLGPLATQGRRESCVPRSRGARLGPASPLGEVRRGLRLADRPSAGGGMGASTGSAHLQEQVRDLGTPPQDPQRPRGLYRLPGAHRS